LPKKQLKYTIFLQKNEKYTIIAGQGGAGGQGPPHVLLYGSPLGKFGWF